MATHHVPGSIEFDCPKATNGRLPGSVIFIRPASTAANTPRVVPLAVLPSAKVKTTGWPRPADHVAGRHHDAVLADNHAAAGSRADPDTDHRRHDLGRHRLDPLFHRLQPGQILGASMAARSCATAADSAKATAKPSPKAKMTGTRRRLADRLASFIMARCLVDDKGCEDTPIT